ncbi:MAG: porin [Pasteurellaceae bacterium]|nr:porin [Pasteurellaceae bacterium]
MKKTLLALSVAAFATTANAAVIYNNTDTGSRITFDGSVRLQLEKDYQKRTDLKDTGSRITVRGEQDIGNGLTALGNIEFRFTDSEIGDSVKAKRLYAGFKHADVGTLTFGKQLTTGDAVGLSDYTYELGTTKSIDDAGNKVIHFISKNLLNSDKANFQLGGDYLFGEADRSKQQDNNGGWVVGAFYDQQFDNGLGFKTEAGYSEGRKVDTNGKYTHKSKAFRAAAELSYAGAAIAFDFFDRHSNNDQYTISWRALPASSSNSGVEATRFHKVREYAIGAKYQLVEQSKIYGGYTWGKAHYAYDATNNTNSVSGKAVKMSKFTLGADYQINKNLVTYLEGARIVYKGDILGEARKDHKLQLGMRVFF